MAPARARARGRRAPGRRDAALILVVVVIAALLAIAAPFVLSMRLHEKSSAGFEAQVRAEHLAESGRNLAAAHLLRSHPDEERRARELAGDLASDPEGVDTWDEVSDVPLGPLPGRFGLRTDDPTASLLHVEVQDERGKLDLNTAGGDALANLLGVTVSTAPLSYDATDELRVEDSSAFWSDGDPTTLDGFVRIGSEDIAYRHIDRARHALQGLTRGYLFSRWIPPEDDAVRRELHPAGSLVQDGRGRKIALDPLWRYLGTEREGQLARFDNVAAVRRIADWELGVARMRLVLARMGLTMRQLRTWGIDGADLERAGLSADELDPDVPPPGETSEQRAARQEAERTLRRYGLDPERVRRYGGVRAVLRTAAQLEAMPADARRALAERYEEFHTKRQEELDKVTGWLREETRRQLASLSEARDQAPRLETIGRIELEERLRPYLTVDALPEGEGWSDPQPVNHPLRFALEQGASTLRIADPRRFRSGAVVQVRPRPGAPIAGLPPEFRLIANARERDGRVTLAPPLERDYEASEVELSARLPRPINVNTASREVLRAALTGLQSRVGQRQRAAGRQAPDIVTPREADAIARALVAREGGLSGPDELRALLLQLASEGAITDHDVDAVLRNAIDPCDDQLVRATVPFCYTTSDTYEITSTGIIGTPAGLEQARHTLREVVRVAPPRLLRWRIDSQADFTDRLYVEGPRPRGERDEAARLFLPGRWQNLLQSRPVHLGPYGATPYLMPSRSHAPGEGDILPLLAREPQTGLPEGSAGEPDWSGPSGGPQAGWLRFERFDGQPEGAPLASFGIGRADMPSRWYQLESGEGHQAAGPGLARGWVRFDTLPGPGEKAFLLDGGERDTIERISLYLEGPSRLVLEAWDEALDLQESGGSPRPARVVHERATPFRQGNWYHIAAYFKGTEPGDLALAVDGELRFRDETPGSRLAVALDPTATTLTVEDASSFPDHGWIRVGAGRWLTSPSAEDRGIADTGQDANRHCEVLHYSRKSGNTLYLDPHPQPVAALLAAGATVQRVVDQDDGNRAIAPGSLPPQVRRPERGSGHRVRVDYVPGAPAQPRRQSLTFTLGFAHGAGTRVVPYGFHSRIKNEGPGGFQDVVRRGGRHLAQPLAPNTPAAVLYAPVPGYTRQNLINQGAAFDLRPVVLPAGATRIPVLWAGPWGASGDPPVDPVPLPPLQGNETEADRPLNVLGGWPQGGVVRISSSWTSPAGAVYQNVERVYFQRVVKVGPQYFLDGCRRGVEGTTPSDHVLFASVVLESLELDGPPGTDYPPRADPSEPRVYVSLTRPDPSAPSGRVTEWLSVQHPQDPRALGGRHFLLLPARESMLAAPPVPLTLPTGQTVTTQGGPGVIDFPYLDELIGQLLDLGGTFPDADALAAPALATLPLPIRGQLWKEVFKRWDPSDASAAPPLRLVVNGQNVSVPRPQGLAEAGARKTKGTRAPATGWPTGTPVVPTFAIRPGDGANWGANAGSVQPFGAECGEGDLVTVADDQQDVFPLREEARVVWSAPSLSGGNLPGGLTAGLLSPLGVVPDAADGWLVAFEGFVAREYLGAANARLARWPVGNLHSLPALTAGAARPPTDASDVVADAPGTLEGRVDDVVVQQLEDGANSVLTLRAPLGASDTASPPVSGQPQAWDDGRLYLAGSEVIAVVAAQDAGAGGGVTLTLERGALGSQAQAIGADTPLWRLPWPPVAVSAGGFSGTRGAALPVRPLREQRAFRERVDGGYLRVGADYDQPARIVPYARFVQRGPRGPYFERPVDALGRGAFDSAFGADPAAPAGGELLVDMPFRHHDRYRDAVDSLDGVFFQASRELPGSFVERVTWDEHLPSHSLADVKVAVRIDGAPGWDATPWADGPGQRGRLYVFDDPRGDNRIGLAAERVELRVYLTFRPGAFAQDGWKDGALVGAIEVQYRQPTQSLRREERAQ